jgi:hypothetical protein
MIVAFAVSGIVNIVTTMLMSNQVDRKSGKREGFQLRRDMFAIALARRHRELFPGSLLPSVAQFSGFIIIALIVAALLQSKLLRK